ncbi:hypothetical protein [Pseudonocardia alni]|uniref:Uncharacterized protein n=1 Tax=Pseudonocardia alni TaxID=33907 RepID=A0A852W067_PSEA5|nr:hypothetical protein [Pseudonocardia antarctica]NYG00881.1 hypothetical protein [Pseudonocardia antarctica]
MATPIEQAGDVAILDTLRFWDWETKAAAGPTADRRSGRRTATSRP